MILRKQANIGPQYLSCLGLPAEECKVVVWADFEHDDTMEVLSKECHALSDDEQDSSDESVEEEEEVSEESAEEADDNVETEFVPGHVRIIKEEEEEEDEGMEVLGGDDDDIDHLQHDNVDHDNDLPLDDDDYEYPELYGGHPTQAEEDSNEFEEAELEGEELEEPSVQTDEHKIRKKVLPAEQARLRLVNRAMNKLLSDESMTLYSSKYSSRNSCNYHIFSVQDISEESAVAQVFQEVCQDVQQGVRRNVGVQEALRHLPREHEEGPVPEGDRARDGDVSMI